MSTQGVSWDWGWGEGMQSIDSGRREPRKPDKVGELTSLGEKIYGVRQTSSSPSRCRRATIAPLPKGCTFEALPHPQGEAILGPLHDPGIVQHHAGQHNPLSGHHRLVFGLLDESGLTLENWGENKGGIKSTLKALISAIRQSWRPFWLAVGHQ